MNNVHIDYLTVSIRPDDGNVCTVASVLDELARCFFMEDWLPWFERIGSSYRYSEIYSFNSVQLKLPLEVLLNKNGICLEFSGSGLEYYREYLSTRGVDERTVYKRFIALSDKGYKTNCSRCDTATDDIAYNGDSGLLDLDVIEDSLKSGAYISFFRKSDPNVHSQELHSVYNVIPSEIDEKLPMTQIESMNSSAREVGKTIYLGKRKSNTFVRFYNKKVEQLANGSKLPDGLSHWVRFEVEWKRKNASAVFMEYALSENDEKFLEWYSGLVLNYLRFIDLDHSRKSNCSTSGWWFNFLQRFEKVKWVRHQTPRNKYISTTEHFVKQYSGILFQLAQCDFQIIERCLSEGKKKVSKTKQLILADFNALRGCSERKLNEEYRRSLETLSGVEHWRSFTNDDEFKFNVFLRHLRQQVFADEVGKTDVYEGEYIIISKDAG